jgi:hypothetical protein
MTYEQWVAEVKDTITSAQNCLKNPGVTPEQRSRLERYIATLQKDFADAERTEDALKKAAK